MAPLTINLQNATDLTNNGIVVISLTGFTANTKFGYRTAFVKDITADGKDEIAANTQETASQVLVFKGRDLTGVSLITVALSTGGTDNATVVRLAPDSDASGNFGSTAISGTEDLDADGIPDIVVTQTTAYAQATQKTITIFRGGYINSRFGQTIRVLTTAGTGTGTGIIQNEKGMTISGSFDKAITIGNFDDDPNGTSADMAYIIYATTSNRGKVFVRRNVKDPLGSFGFGTLPYESPVLVDPLDPTGLKFGYFGVVPIGDFNGDGFPDLLVATDGAGYATILY